MKHFSLALLILLVCLAAGPAYAGTCSNPAGNEADWFYNGNYHVPQFCNGTSWTNAGWIASPDAVLGDASIEANQACGNANTLQAQEELLQGAATITGLSMYVSAAAGNLILGIYDATGPGGGPGNLLATTAGFTPTTGWNTVSVVTPVALAAGIYWLAFLPSSNSLCGQYVSYGFYLNNFNSSYYYSYTYGALPSTFSTSPGVGDPPSQYSFYATGTGSCGRPYQFGVPVEEGGESGGNANYVQADEAPLSQSGTLQSISIYIYTAAGQMILGVYDATGPGGGAGNLLATTAGFTPTVGWNTVPVVTPVALSAGNYWLAFNTNNNSMNNAYTSTPGTIVYYSYTYGAFPSTFATSGLSSVGGYNSEYATVTGVGQPGNEGDQIYNGDYHTWQFCNGTTWQAMELVVSGGGGGGCSNPAGKEADRLYNGDHHTYQFCNGTNWKAFGGGAAE